MIYKLLTGGIDVPKLASDVAGIRSAIKDAASQGRPHLGEGSTVAEVIYWLRCRIDKLDNLIASRALAQDVETLRLRLDRIAGEVVHPGEGYLVPTLATTVADLKISNANLSAQVASLSKQVEALTAAKLSEVKARKAPKKT